MAEQLLFQNQQYSGEYAQMRKIGFNPELLLEAMQGKLQQEGAVEVWRDTLSHIADGTYPIMVLVRPHELYFIPDPGEIGKPNFQITYRGEAVSHPISHQDDTDISDREEINQFIADISERYNRSKQDRINLFRTRMPVQGYPKIPNGICYLRGNLSNKPIMRGPMYLRVFTQIRDGILSQKVIS